MAARAQCLQERGWVDAEYDGTSGLSVSVPQGQAERFEEDDRACKAHVGFKQVGKDVGTSESSLSRLYDLELETAKCLQDLGYEPGEPPSRQVFIDSYETGGAWIAYGQLPAMSESEFRTVSETCPQASERLGETLWNEMYGPK